MWKDLNESQKKEYNKYCDNKYGKSFTFSETGEPLYFNENFRLIDCKIIIDLLFSKFKN